jgi:3',5'-nucleoside bisphosphate phosphatase
MAWQRSSVRARLAPLNTMAHDDRRPRFDLQSHSDRSDGVLAPAQVVRLAHASGVELLALSDHDTVSGVPEALQAARAAGIELVSAVELSALDDGRENHDLHVLGYGFDHRDQELLGALERFRADRGKRAGRMVEALRQLGLKIDDELLLARTRTGHSIGRPHLALAVLNDPRNAERLREEGLGDASQILETYLLPGQPAYRGRTTPTVGEAISAIHAAGGLAVWAHPFWDIRDPEQVLDAIARFVAVGLDGVEAFYVTHNREQTLLLAHECERLELLSTGSSDFHGPNHRLFSGFRSFSLHGAAPRLGAIAGPLGGRL